MTKEITRADLRCGAILNLTFNRNVLEQYWKDRFNYLYNIEEVLIKFQSELHEENFYRDFECIMIDELEGAGKLSELYLEFENFCDTTLNDIYSKYKKGDMVYPQEVWVEISYNSSCIDDSDRDSLKELSPGVFAIDSAFDIRKK